MELEHCRPKAGHNCDVADWFSSENPSFSLMDTAIAVTPHLGGEPSPRTSQVFLVTATAELGHLLQDLVETAVKTYVADNTSTRGV